LAAGVTAADLDEGATKLLNVIMRSVDRMAELINDILDVEKTVGIEAYADGGIRFYVSDKGIGIPNEFRSQIFERFSQVGSSDRRKKGGTGLGMAISKSIVDSHKGQIDVTSVEGEGTIFYFDLPQSCTFVEKMEYSVESAILE